MSQTININTIYKTTITIDISTTDTTDFLKSKIQDVIGVHPDCQYLYYNEMYLEDNKLLSDYNIKNEDVIIQYDRIKK
jgi:hypothetical protein